MDPKLDLEQIQFRTPFLANLSTQSVAHQGKTLFGVAPPGRDFWAILIWGTPPWMKMSLVAFFFPCNGLGLRGFLRWTASIQKNTDLTNL